MRVADFMMRVRRWLNRNVDLYVKRDPFLLALRQWHRDGGDERFRFDYPLGPGSTVVDVGGYRGDWSHRLIERYGCTVHVFEAVPGFATEIRERFRGCDKVTTHAFGLSDGDRVVSMSLAADGSSAFRTGADFTDVRFRDVDSVLREYRIDEIDLIKINIEGGEYGLLRRMLDSGIVERCRDIQVQFHLDYPDAVHLRDELRRELQRTHELTYDYYFVWENWHRRAE